MIEKVVSSNYLNPDSPRYPDLQFLVLYKTVILPCYFIYLIGYEMECDLPYSK